ncbi:glucocorticoid modulatory element-binding protein 1 isoform X1 [Tachysurus fulvidraco]|uniref:glucocorticoid modulatory element-binding protein 1 isoform X1 n=2 Tax=Tachysurus fulvidraco TaxID=1234273 RepID=UPI000F4FA0B5|nr:glucocorticoid modulatory element-binding protein 1 isoform X1 [Tachysurus fulvidraco]
MTLIVAQKKDMAETDVTMSMGDVVMMKATDDEVAACDSNKTQVILQLQPITPGTEDNTGETATADEVLSEGGDVELGYPITCGESKAVLLFKKFVCPGINVKCVKYEDELISPKQFVHMSGKATLKDWKRAIRMGGVMLRKMMDSGQLDFYQHSTLCTNTCRSTKFDLLINNTRFPPDGSVLSTSSSSSLGQVTVGNGAEVVTIEEKPEEASSSLDWASAEVTKKKEVAGISEETLSFWKGIADVGLTGEVVSNIRTELLEMLRGVQLRSDQANLQDVEVAVLSNLTQVFGLLDSIKRILAVRRQMTDLGQKHLLKTLMSLEHQLEEQKKQQAQSWLVSSSSSPPPPKRAPKRPRLHRPASATVLQPLTLHSPQYTLISPITLSSVCQPITFPGLAQPPGAVTLFTHVPQHDGRPETLTLVGTMAAQEPAQLNTVELGAVGTMGTVELGAAGAVEMANTVLVQDHESQAIEINLQMGAEAEGPAKEEEERRRMEGEGEDGSGIMVEDGEKEMKVEMEELHLETNGQIHNLQIFVVEDEEQMQVEGKSE